MLFFLNIIFPFVIAIAYFIQLKVSFYFFDKWPLFFSLLIILDIIFFLVIGIKNKDKKIIPLFLYSLILLTLGFLFSSIITNNYLINIFIVLWPVISFIFLDSVCHQTYKTNRADFLNLKNVIPYINLLIVFLLTSSLLYLNIFLTFPSWGLIPIFFVCINVIIFSLLRSNDLKPSQAIIYSSVLALIFTEVMGALLLLPTGFYVLAIIETVVYYCLISLFMLSLENKLSKKSVLKYVFVGSTILLIALATSQWF